MIASSSGDAPVTSVAQQEQPAGKGADPVEFRDQHGNLLDPEQVKEMEGQDIKFQTKVEVKTKIVDEAGEFVEMRAGEGAGVHPPHPDVEGRNPNTAGKGEKEANEAPPRVGADADVR